MAPCRPVLMRSGEGGAALESGHRGHGALGAASVAREPGGTAQARCGCHAASEARTGLLGYLGGRAAPGLTDVLRREPRTTQRIRGAAMPSRGGEAVAEHVATGCFTAIAPDVGSVSKRNAACRSGGQPVCPRALSIRRLPVRAPAGSQTKPKSCRDSAGRCLAGRRVPSP